MALTGPTRYRHRQIADGHTEGMHGRARAPGAGTVLNAIASGTGAAFAIDLHTEAAVSLSDETGVHATISENPAADTTLIETCFSLTLDRYGTSDVRGGTVRTESEIPMASGLKSSSAAANATILATLSALDVRNVDRIDACRLGVEAARKAGVTITGAFDDASASMLGGVTVTDNSTDELIQHEPFDYEVAIHTPTAVAFSADTDVDRCQSVAPVAVLVAELARTGRYPLAMTVNGFAFAGALDQSAEPMIAALPDVAGVSLSGTGPSTVAIGTESQITQVIDRWSSLDGVVRRTTTNAAGTTILEHEG